MLALGLDLAEAVRQAQQGDQAAFTAIYEQFAAPLFRYVLVRCGDVGLAEELTSELWLRVVERLPAFRCPADHPEKAFPAWLYQIARNLAIDAARRGGTAALPLPETMIAREAPLDEWVIGREEQQALCAALAHLTPEQRDVLLLRFLEAYNTADVARLLGRSEGAVKGLQHRALAAVARTLGGQRGRK